VRQTHNIIVLGAGHNGLVTAFYLARAGLKPLVLERRPVVGGAAITDEFHRGFRCSTLAHTSGPLRAEIARDMRLRAFGLETIQPDPTLFLPAADGRALMLYRDPDRSARAIAALSRKDAERYLELHGVLRRMGRFLGQILRVTPPSIDQPTGADLWNLLKAGKSFRSLGKREMLRLLRWLPMAVADVAEEWFDTELLRATLAARGIFGTFFGPRSAGTAAVFLLRAAADSHPAGSTVFPRGGMGALTEAMARAARGVGVGIRTGTECAQILVKNGAVRGVVLSGGEEVAATAVVSNADPQRTFLRLVDPVHLPPNFVVKMRNYRCQGAFAKVNLALDGLPTFAALAAEGSNGTALAGRLQIGPEVDYLERAFDEAKYGQFSRRPYLEVTLPSVSDSTLAPPGQHVMSVCVQFAPFALRNDNWKSQREALGDAVVRTLAAYAPNLPELILHRQVITPQDLEETYSLTGGHIFHGELALDQLFTMRPLLDWARYRTPLQGLYLCGSGTHPGTGLTGDSGANAAREILKDLRR
jgi:phytoene dehydrogenase-like protein